MPVVSKYASKDVYLSLYPHNGGVPLVLLMIAPNLRINSRGHVVESIRDRKGREIDERRIVEGLSFADDFKYSVATGEVKKLDAFKEAIDRANLEEAISIINFFTTNPDALLLAEMIEAYGTGDRLFCAYTCAYGINESTENYVIRRCISVISRVYHVASMFLNLDKDSGLASLPLKVQFSNRMLMRFILELRLLTNGLYGLIKFQEHEMQQGIDRMRNHEYPVEQLMKGFSGVFREKNSHIRHVLTIDYKMRSMWELIRNDRSEACYINIHEDYPILPVRMLLPLQIQTPVEDPSLPIVRKRRRDEDEIQNDPEKKIKIEEVPLMLSQL